MRASPVSVHHHPCSSDSWHPGRSDSSDSSEPNALPQQFAKPVTSKAPDTWATPMTVETPIKLEPTTTAESPTPLLPPAMLPRGPEHSRIRPANKELARQRRLAKNRRTAAISRQRRKDYVRKLEDNLNQAHKSLRDTERALACATEKNEFFRQLLLDAEPYDFEPAEPPPAQFAAMHLAPSKPVAVPVQSRLKSPHGATSPSAPSTPPEFLAGAVSMAMESDDDSFLLRPSIATYMAVPTPPPDLQSSSDLLSL